MEQFVGLQASQVSGTVTITWTANPVPGITSQVLQRAPFGSTTFTTIATPALGVLTATDAPGVGDWTYRLFVVSPQGSVDALGTGYFSNYANVSTEAATGVLTLTAATSAANDPIGYTNVILSWTDSSTGGIDLVYQIQRQIGTGAFRTVEQIDARQGTYTEVLPAGSGPYSYQILALVPPISVGKQQIQTTSNTVVVNP